MNYESIKDLAKEIGVRVTDLIALAPQNDPFYVGRPAENEAAYWFADYWNHFGYSGGIHLRRIHYRMVSQSPPVIMPNGKPYENTMDCWAFLNNASKWARYIGLVDPAMFVDRRNPDAIQYARYDYEDSNLDYALNRYDGYSYTDAFPRLDEIALPALPEQPPDWVDFTVTGYEWLQPPIHVEVWCEKTTMNDILQPLCDGEGVNLVTGAGELSITATLQFMDRVVEADRPARIIYISDFDPAGLGMPISVARKIEYWQNELHRTYGRLDIRLEPVVLTLEQVKRYRLPRVPVKESDRRKNGWERDFGAGAVELDALEALHPGELQQIISGSIARYRDRQYNRKASTLRYGLIGELAAERAYIMQAPNIAERIDDLNAAYADVSRELDAITAQMQAAISPYLPRLAALNQQLEILALDGQAIDNDIAYRLNEVDVDMGKYDLPDPNVVDPEDALYDSRREYLDQLNVYQSYRKTGATE